MMRIYLGLALICLLTACADNPHQQATAQAQQAYELATDCRYDTEAVPAEHSEHCIEASRLIFDYTRDDGCNNLNDINCLKLENYELWAESQYWNAIAQSIAKFGLPEGVSAENGGHYVYRFHDRMQDHFGRCVATEMRCLSLGETLRPRG